MNYIKQLLIALDQLGNAIAGGNADVTVSGRIGYHAGREGSSGYWSVLERVVDWAFFPIDGPGHCKQSIELCEEVAKDSTFGLVAVSLLVYLFAPVIGLLVHMYSEIAGIKS